MQKNMKKYWPIFTIPVMAAFAIGFVIPFILGIYLSFTKFTTVKDAHFVGLANYRKLFADATYLHSFFLTLAFAIATIIIINIIAFFLAMALTQKLKGTNLFRTVFFMPNLIGGIVLGYIWQLIFSGILVHFNTALNLNARLGFWGLVILVCWQQIGYMMIIYISGLQAIPTDVMEATEIDGANGVQKLFRVTLPMMMPSITICTFLTLTNGFKLFDQNLALTGGAPMKQTELMALNIYQTFYGRVGFEGVGQAKAVIFFLIVIVMAGLQQYFTKSKEVQQ
ncbi:MAG: sugar ABC transporter permease [Bulleidia sp.]|jgi:raffinose/stachyose/melibiose transport system permease protein|nr:sugar ABC transporter permease [Bulleidia sp.]